MANKWKVAGYLFTAATVVLLISLMMNIHTYYIKEMESGQFTMSEVCDDRWEDDFGSTSVCYPVKQARHNLFAGALFSAGFAFLCFAKYGETKTESEPTVPNNQSLQQPHQN